MRSINTIAANSVLALALCASSIAHAYDLPNINLGLTSFMDSPPVPSATFAFQQYFMYVGSDRLNDNNGNKQAFPPKQDSDVVIALSQLTYFTPYRLAGGKLGFNMVVPTLVSASTDDGMGGKILSYNKGLGDITAGPLLWFDPIMGPNGPVFSHRIELDVIAPTGKYDDNKAINPGTNFWAFNPYYSFTYWFAPRWNFSGRLHYLWSGKNTDPPVNLGPGVYEVQAGQAVHANFALGYEVSQDVMLGINGYWLKQIEDTKINNHEVSGRREKVTALGPGALWRITQSDMLYLNIYKEFAVENRTEGSRVVLHYMKLFD